MNEKINFEAIGEDYPPYFPEVLNNTVIQQYVSIKKFLSTRWNSANEEKIRLLKIISCLNKFTTSIFQIYRLVKHHNHFLTRAAMIRNSELQMCFAADEACSDFESFLLQSRAALDVLTYFVTSQFKNPNTKFSKLEPILENFQSYSCARKIRSFLDESKWVKGIFVNDEQQMSLRSRVAHIESVNQIMNGCYGIYFFTPRKVLISDIQFSNYALFKTALEATKYIPFLILNTLALFSTKEVNPMENYNQNWENFAISLPDFYTDDPKGISLTVIESMLPAGFRTTENKFSNLIYSKLLQIDVFDEEQFKEMSEKGWKKVGRLSGKLVGIKSKNN